MCCKKKVNIMAKEARSLLCLFSKMISRVLFHAEFNRHISIIYLAVLSLIQSSAAYPLHVITSSYVTIACLSNLFGLATCEVYLAPFVAKESVVSYTAFSPFPSVVAHCLVVCLCGTFCYLYITYKHPSVRWHITLCCPDFPLQLPEAIAHFA